MSVYYNENDPYAVRWLRELIKAGVLADGEVDDRSITNVRPTDLKGFTQCHFFAGIGGWSEALRLAGWPDDRPVWTGSCPCQPYSAAGAQQGHADPRDLWPVWFPLIQECCPRVVFGEQVEAAIRHGWLDRVHRDMEGEGYACGAVVLGAHSVGAPHIRQRLYFVAESQSKQYNGCGDAGRGRGEFTDGSELGDSHDPRSQGRRLRGSATSGNGPDQQPAGPSRLDGPALEHPSGHGRIERGSESGERGTGSGCGEGGMAYPSSERRNRIDTLLRPKAEQRGSTHAVLETAGGGESGVDDTQRRTGQSRENFWSACDWLPCRDGKSRPVEPGTFPLAHGVPQRVGRLRGYGNAILPQVGAEFIKAYLATL